MKHETFKKNIIKYTTTSREIRAQIHTLIWKSDVLQEVQRILSERAPTTKYKINGKRAIKHLRRPETGLKRNQLWAEKQRIGFISRHTLLAYAFVRGIPYLHVEQKTKNSAVDHMIIRILKENGVDVTTKQVTEWLSNKFRFNVVSIEPIVDIEPTKTTLINYAG